jgi:hypothetical protein
MAAAQRGRHYMAPHTPQAHKTEAMYRQASGEYSFDSIRYASNASQPSLSHSTATYPESTPSSVCRPEFGDYPHDMAHSDCGASFISEVPPSLDDNSDIDEARSTNSSKPTLIKFVEPVVQRDHHAGQPRLTGMKKKMQKKKSAQALQSDADLSVHHLPILGFDEGLSRHSSEQGMLKDAMHFPSVPPRDGRVAPKHEQWNVDAIDIALDDLVLEKGKTRSMLVSPSSSVDTAVVPTASDLRAKAAAMRASASVLDEARQDDLQYRSQPRARTLSNAPRSPRRLPADMPPLPPLPSGLVQSASGNILNGLQTAAEHPLSTPDIPSSPARSVASGAAFASRSSVSSQLRSAQYSPDEENVFAFSPPSLSGHGEEATPASAELPAARGMSNRLGSMASSNHSSLKDMDPREVIQRARMQSMSCGLDAEIAGSVDLADESPSFDSATRGHPGVQAEDLPPLLSNHYLQGNEFSAIDQAQCERLHRLPERMQAAAAAAAAAASAAGSHRLSHKHLSKHRKGAGAPSVVNHYEPISILRAEAAFLKDDVKKTDKEKKKKLWQTPSSSSSVSSRSHAASSLSRTGIYSSTSDVSSVSDSQHRLKSFKSSIRLKTMK